MKVPAVGDRSRRPALRLGNRQMALWCLHTLLLTPGLTFLADTADAGGPKVVEHVTVCREPGRFGGWPANHGIWSWDNEILVGFSWGYYKDLGDRHHIDREKPEEHLLARSLDGGQTWTVENPAEKGMLIPEGEARHGTELPNLPPNAATD